MSIEEVIDFLKSKKKLYFQMDESDRKDYVMECLDTAINLLSNMTNGDLISRKSAITMLQKICNSIDDGNGFQLNEWVEYANDIPSSEKTAEWKAHYNEKDHRYSDLLWFCTNCGERFVIDGKDEMESFKYCPNCGTKMKEGDKE